MACRHRVARAWVRGAARRIHEALDAIAAIEACYRPGNNAEWARGLLAALSPLDQGLGLLVVAYDVGHPSRIQFGVLGTNGNEPPQAIETMTSLYRAAPRELLQSLYAASPAGETVSPRLRAWPRAQEFYDQAGIREAEPTACSGKAAICRRIDHGHGLAGPFDTRVGPKNRNLSTR